MQLRPSRIPRPERAFTLIELLVVISIIAILASLALPALNGAMTAAKKGQANAMISQLKVAVTGYNTEYGTWPTAGNSDSETLDTKTLYKVLTATEGNSPTYNTRNIVFMEFAAKDTDTAGTAQTPTMYVDPWYKTNKQQANQNYTVIVDGDFNNSISGLPTGSGGPTTINASIAIWDPGPPTKSGTVNANTDSHILKSW